MAIGFQPRPAEGLSHPNVVQMAFARVRRTPEAPAFRVRNGGVWRTIPWVGWWNAAVRRCALLTEMGAAPGQVVALAGQSGLDWATWDLAIAMTGAMSMPLDDGRSPPQQRQLLDHAGCDIVIADAEACQGGVAAGRACLPFEAEASGWSGDAGAEIAPFPLSAAELPPDGPFTLIYTSGVLAPPRAVALSHRNVVYESWALRNVIPVDEDDEQLLLLPLAHMFGRHLFWGAVEQGVTTALADPRAPILEVLQDVAPTYFAAIPNQFEALRRRILAELLGPNRLARQAFELALEVGLEVADARERVEELSTSLNFRWTLADRAMLSRVRAAFGPRLRFLLSGGGPLAESTLAFYHGCGLLLLEGYGSVETSGAISVNRADRYRRGSAGPPLPGCAVRIDDDGEILARGPNLMLGYHREPAATQAAMADHGWLRTGDLGELRDGFLWVHGRKQDRFVAPDGTEIVPQVLERQLERAPEISHAIVGLTPTGEVGVMIALERPEMDAWGTELGVQGLDPDRLARHPRVRHRIDERVDAVNRDLPEGARMHRIVVLPREVSASSGDLSPTGRLRRGTLWNEAFSE